MLLISVHKFYTMKFAREFTLTTHVFTFVAE